MIPNSMFISHKNDNYLTIDEGYLFSLLYRYRIPYGSVAIFSIDGISELSVYKFMSIKPNGDASRNKNKIRQIIKSLINKEYIYLEEDIDYKKNSELLYIEFFEIKHYHQFTKGHNQNILYKTFDMFENPLEFYIYAYIDRFGENGSMLSYEQWSDITGVSHDKIEEVINKMNTYSYKPRIWKFSGSWIPSNKTARQEMNTYYTRPDEETIKKWNGYYAKGNKDKIELAFGCKGGDVKKGNSRVDELF